MGTLNTKLTKLILQRKTPPSAPNNSPEKKPNHLNEDRPPKKANNKAIKSCSRKKSHRLLYIRTTILTLCTTSGCTSITIIDREGNTRIEHHFGFTKLELNPNKEAVVAEVSALGFYSGPTGTSLGFEHSTIASIPNTNECLLIVWPKEFSEIESIYTPFFRNFNYQPPSINKGPP